MDANILLFAHVEELYLVLVVEYAQSNSVGGGLAPPFLPLGQHLVYPLIAVGVGE